MRSTPEDLSERDIELLKKATVIYLQLNGVLDLSELLKRIFALGNEGEDLKKLQHYVLYLIVASAVKSAREALNDRLSYRELVYDFNPIVFGVPDVIRTIVLYSRGLVSYYTYREGANAPEFKVMGYLLRMIYQMAEGLIERVKVEEDDRKGLFSYDLNGKIQELKEVLQNFPEGFYRDPVYTDPPWLREAFAAYFTLREIMDITAYKRSRVTGQGAKKGLRLLLWDLYEHYLIYLVVKVLEGNKFRIMRGLDRGDEERYLVAYKEGELIDLLRHRSLEGSNLTEMTPKGLKESAKKRRGRPDLSLVGKDWTIIFECKYSTSPTYLTASRFKTMAYALEYMPKAAVLVYPGLEEREVKDKELSETVELDRLTKRKGLVGFVFKDERKGWETTVYMARIDPQAEDEENERIITEVLKEVV